MDEQQFYGQSSGEQPYTFKLFVLAIHDTGERTDDLLEKNVLITFLERSLVLVTVRRKLQIQATLISDKNSLSLVG